MAKKNESNQKTDYTKVKDKAFAEIQKLVEKRNQALKAGAYNLISKENGIDDKIDEQVKLYTDAAEKEVFKTLSEKKKPFVEAAKMLTFTTVKVQEKKDDNKKPVTVINSIERAIDPKRLQDYVGSNIGASEQWVALIEKLNFLLTSRRAVELGIDPTTISQNYKMSEEADKITALLFDAKKYDKATADDILKGDLETAINAMIGGKKEVPSVLVNYLLMIYTKKSNKEALKVACANHNKMRAYCMEICHAILTGKMPTIEYKIKK